MARSDPTLRQIASTLGLHYSTVSRVLNGTEEQAAAAAGAATQQRIRAAADEIGYSPDPLGRGLRTHRSALIGVLVPQLRDPAIAAIYEGIQTAANHAGYYTLVTNTFEDPATHRLQLRGLLERRVDALILADTRIDSDFDELVRREVPFVLVNRPHPGVPSITVDDYEGGRLAAQHLLDVGCRDIAILTGPEYARTSLDRAAGARDALAAAGRPVPDERVLYRAYDAPGGRRAATELLRQGGDPPDGIFVASDGGAIGAMAALRERGLQVPADVALVGFSDLDFAADLPVPLTTVRSPMQEMGADGAHAVLELLGGGAPETRRLEPALIVRESTRRAKGI